MQTNGREGFVVCGRPQHKKYSSKFQSDKFQLRTVTQLLWNTGTSFISYHNTDIYDTPTTDYVCGKFTY